MEELNEAMKLSKKGKAPGPDGIRMELIDPDNRKWLLNTINKWWDEKKAPEELYHARVATIYKKGETDKASNYRPISLLSSFYKIYMIMIRSRIQAEAEKEVSKTQYGFRPAKSTTHAIYIIRRLQDFAERSRHPLFLTLLDWEKAFDKVEHKALCEAMKRLGIEDGLIEALKDGYDKATFFVEDAYGKLEKKPHHSGIRQGCPHSPYLFVHSGTSGKCQAKPNTGHRLRHGLLRRRHNSHFKRLKSNRGTS